MKIGQQVRDYVLEERIGQGGSGEVWRARHQRLGKDVAIKIIFPHLVRDPDFQGRFLQEAQAMARLEHPHIVGVHDFLSEHGTAFLVMSYIEGGSLEDRLRVHVPLPVDSALEISREVLSALDFAHRQGVIHRDVKPSNILLSRNGHSYLADFGIALMMGKKRVTKTGSALGTPYYMSPEQIRGLKAIDHRTDVYSYGCVLYEMLSGYPPFGESDGSSTDFEIMAAHVKEAPPPLRERNVQVDADIETVVMTALEKDPDERYHGCQELALALSGQAASSSAPRVCSHCGTSARPSAAYCRACGARLS